MILIFWNFGIYFARFTRLKPPLMVTPSEKRFFHPRGSMNASLCTNPLHQHSRFTFFLTVVFFYYVKDLLFKIVPSSFFSGFLGRGSSKGGHSGKKECAKARGKTKAKSIAKNISGRRKAEDDTYLTDLIRGRDSNDNERRAL